MASAENARIAGIFAHPLRDASDHSMAQLHAKVAAGALADAGLDRRVPGWSTKTMS
jgi:acetyl-CoA C-acetyltransferase